MTSEKPIDPQLMKAIEDPQWAFEQLPKEVQEEYEDARRSCIEAAIWSRPRNERYLP